MKKIIFILFTLTILCLACSKEDAPVNTEQEQGEMVLNFSVEETEEEMSIGTYASVAATANEKRIQSIRIFVFDETTSALESNYIITYKGAIWPDASGIVGSKVIPLAAPKGTASGSFVPKLIYVIANENQSSFRITIPTNPTLSEIQDIKVSLNGLSRVSREPLLPMAAFYKYNYQYSGGSGSINDVDFSMELKRVVSKIEIENVTETQTDPISGTPKPGGEWFDIQNVDVTNLFSSTYLFKTDATNEVLTQTRVPADNDRTVKFFCFSKPYDAANPVKLTINAKINRTSTDGVLSGGADYSQQISLAPKDSFDGNILRNNIYGASVKYIISTENTPKALIIDLNHNAAKVRLTD